MTVFPVGGILNTSEKGLELERLSKETGNPVAEITMESGGKMMIELYPGKAPITVANFVDLARRGFYDGLAFHRVVKDFMIQGGSKSGSCAGEDIGFTIRGEFYNNGVDTGLLHKRGAISMARTMIPDSASSQFFICHQDVDFLDNEYAAFGQMTDGFDTLDAIATTPTLSPREENRPLEPQVIRSITIRLGGYEPGEPQRIGKLKEVYASGTEEA